MKLAEKIVVIARQEVGVREIGNTNCGPRVNQYKAATDLPPAKAWPWCAAFVDWVIWQALLALAIKQTRTFKRPRTAGARDLERWSRAQDATTHTRRTPGRDIEPGDIVIFLKISHVGFAVSKPDKNGVVTTVEGNTDAAGSREGGGVFLKRRHCREFKTRIRFTV